MALLSGTDLSKYFGAQEVFTGISFEIHAGECVALVGPNGCGKSTLLEIAAGVLEPDSGALTMARDIRLGYLPQIPNFDSGSTLWEAMLTVFSTLSAQQHELRRLEAEMTTANVTEQEDLMDRYGKLLDAFEQAGGFTYESRIAQVLGGLGFPKEQFDSPVSYLSGGEKTRALLARLLLEEPELLLLDEPTNHLDLAGIEWLEDYLNHWKGAVIVVAHDRAFLDAVAMRVWEMQNQHLDMYRGNYTAYIAQRAERRAQQLAAYKAQQAHIEKTEEYVRRYMAGQRSAEAKGRLKRLEREERLNRPQEQQSINIDLQSTLRSGDLVLGLYNLGAGYEDGEPLVFVEEVEVHRGQRVAIVGPNGSGKTTLLRTVLREIKPLMGRFRIGAAVRPGYFSQIQGHLNPEHTVLEAVLAAGMVSLAETRSFLARYGFRGDDVFKKVGVLSGGEQARVALAILALRKANFLVLDEPTNHLDIPSQEVLQDVLTNFEGTILLVSHDRYLIRFIATHVWAIADGELKIFPGYAAYSDWHQRLRENSPGQKKAAKEQARVEYETKRQTERETQRKLERQQARIKELETQIHTHESRMQELLNALDAAGRAQDVGRVTKLGAEYHQVEATLNHLLEQWIEVADTSLN